MPGDKIIDRIRSLQGEGKHFVSFEFFPPKTADGVRSLMSRIERYREQSECRSARRRRVRRRGGGKRRRIQTKARQIGERRAPFFPWSLS